MTRSRAIDVTGLTLHGTILTIDAGLTVRLV